MDMKDNFAAHLKTEICLSHMLITCTVHYEVCVNSVIACFAELYKQVWLRLNTVLPRCLWVMSINALLHESAAVKNVFLTQENIVLDPLQVLRCDSRVFRFVTRIFVCVCVFLLCQRTLFSF